MKTNSNRNLIFKRKLTYSDVNVRIDINENKYEKIMKEIIDYQDRSISILFNNKYYKRTYSIHKKTNVISLNYSATLKKDIKEYIPDEWNKIKEFRAKTKDNDKDKDKNYHSDTYNTYLYTTNNKNTFELVIKENNSEKNTLIETDIKDINSNNDYSNSSSNNDKTIEEESYTKEDFLEEVFMSEEKYTTLVELLKHKKNIILQGAPGVGKTYIAKRLAYSILGSKKQKQVKMIQFHQSYSYEDFVLGYRPTENSFAIEYGPFFEFCDKAKQDIENKYYFIIDEINRGNLSKIFGELLMLIENDKRDEKVTLLYPDKDGNKIEFSVPENLHIIGMMNTADRSLAMIDYALRRRFSFIEIEPAFDSEGFKKFIINQGDKFNETIKRIEQLNKEIDEDDTLGSGFKIGHSYLCHKEVDDDKLKNIIEYEIIPLLEEYWFDNKERKDKWSSELLGILK